MAKKAKKELDSQTRQLIWQAEFVQKLGRDLEKVAKLELETVYVIVDAIADQLAQTAKELKG